MSEQSGGHDSPNFSPSGDVSAMRARSSRRKDHSTSVRPLRERRGVGARPRVGDELMRCLGAEPTEADLRRAVFRHNSRFCRGEVVLVPRSRGGFSYAKVIKHKLIESCYINPSVKDVRYYAWRVQYTTKQGEHLYKQLPSVYLGKIMNFDMPSRRRKAEEATPPTAKPTKPNVSCDLVPATERSFGIKKNERDDVQPSDDEADDLDGETILFAGFGSSCVSSLDQRASTDDTTDRLERELADTEQKDCVAPPPVDELEILREQVCVSNSLGLDPTAAIAVSHTDASAFAVPETERFTERSRRRDRRQSRKYPPNRRAASAQSVEGRTIGTQASWKDLTTVFFSPGNTFSIGEVVLVPRSVGGMTYGRIEESVRCRCPLGRHMHSGWRVLLHPSSKHAKAGTSVTHAKEGTDEESARQVKDLFSCNVGKLHVGQLPYDPTTSSCVSQAIISSEHVAPQTAGMGNSQRRSDPVASGRHRNPPNSGGNQTRLVCSEFSRDMPFTLPTPEEDDARLLLVPGAAAYEFKDVAASPPLRPVSPHGLAPASSTEISDPAAVQRESRRRAAAMGRADRRMLFNAMAPLRAPSKSSHHVGAAASALLPSDATGANVGGPAFVESDDDDISLLPPPIFDAEGSSMTQQDDGDASFFVDDITAEHGGVSRHKSALESSHSPAPLISLVDRNGSLVSRMKEILGEVRFTAFRELSLRLRGGQVTPAHYYEQLCLEFGPDAESVFEEMVDLLPDPALQVQLRAAKEASMLFVERKSKMVSPTLDSMRMLREAHSGRKAAIVKGGMEEEVVVVEEEEKKKKVMKMKKQNKKKKIKSNLSRDVDRAYASSTPVAPQPGILPFPRSMARISFSSPTLHASTHARSLPSSVEESMGSLSQPKPLIVLDAPNIARRHGGQIISTRGIQLAIQYYTTRGHKVIGFMPEHYFRRKPTSSASAAVLVKNKNALSRQSQYSMADDPELVQTMLDDGVLVLTPPQDYDDSYCIEFARLHNGFIVTNDRYWDHIEGLSGKVRQRTLKWIRSHCISFMFVKDEFLPNPDFKFPPSKTGT